jgi:hypothetical protein
MEPSVPRFTLALNFFVRAILIQLMEIRINKTVCRDWKGKKEETRKIL